MYSDSIQRVMTKMVPGIVVGGQVVRDVVYADDDTLVNASSELSNLALSAINSEGKYNCFKFKPSKCKVIGASSDDLSEHKLGPDLITRDKRGKLLGAVITKSGIDSLSHVKERYDMVKTAIIKLNRGGHWVCPLI